jgi:hypothetical protein
VLKEDQKLLAAESATIVGQILNKLGAIPCVFDDIQLLGHDFKDWQVISIGQCTCKHYHKQDIFEENTIERLFTADAKSFFTLERGYFVGLHREFDYHTLIEYIEREQIIEFAAHLKQRLTGCDAYNAALPTLIVFDDLHRKRNDNGEPPYSQILKIFAKAIQEFNAPAIAALICKGDQVRLIGENSAVCRISEKAGNYYVKHRKDLYSSLLQLPLGWSYLSTGETNPNIGPKTARPVPALVHFFHNRDSNSFNEQEVLEFLLKLCHLKSVASSRTALPFQLREARSMVEKGERS